MGGAGANCRPTPTPVSKLLRLSNVQAEHLASALTGAPVGREPFLLWTPVPQVYGFDTMSEARLDSQGLQAQLTTAGALAARVVASPRFTSACPAPSSSWTWDNCGRPAIVRLAGRAFRRPLRPDELAGYQALFEGSVKDAIGRGPAEPFSEGLGTLVQAVLLSPHALYRPELVPGGFDPSERDFVTAAKLSFYVTGGPPDDELWALAERGGLADGATVANQARRMLGRYADRFVADFGGQWLDFRDGAVTSTEPLIGSMRVEAAEVWKEILTTGLPAQRLLEPGFTMVDQALAKHYGLPFTPDKVPVHKVTTTSRGGLYAQGFFLSRSAEGSDFRRVIYRGLFTLTRLLCEQLPRLDQGTIEEIGESLAKIDRALPLTEQMALHRESGRCGSCHRKMDPLGLPLESYDGRGLPRARDAAGRPITNTFDWNGVPVRNPAELAAAVGKSPALRSCVATKLLTYALHRGPTEAEACVVERLAANPEKPLDALAVEAFLASLELTRSTP
jgi:hypothetical protein